MKNKKLRLKLNDEHLNAVLHQKSTFDSLGDELEGLIRQLCTDFKLYESIFFHLI